MSLDQNHNKWKNHESQSQTNQMLNDEIRKKINHTKNYNYKNESENQNKNKHVLPEGCKHYSRVDV